MSTKIITAAVRINNALLPAEDSTSHAAIASAELVLTLLKQHQASGVAADIGLSAIGHAMRAASLSVEAREAHIRAHGAMNTDLRKIGLDEMFSKTNELPSNDPAPGFFSTGQLSSSHEPAAA